MSRLIVFGCSLCYGIGLDDCWPQPTPPSKHCWPEIVAKELNLICVNMSIPGAGNKAIWNSIKNFKFQKDDLVFILWSFPDRYSIIESSTSVKNLHHNRPNQLSDAYYNNLYNKYDSTLMSKLFVEDANRFLNDQGIKFYQMTYHRYYWDIFGDLNHLKITMLPYERSYPKALDDDHAGQDGHTAFAIDLLKIIGHHGKLSKPNPPSLIDKILFFLRKFL